MKKTITLILAILIFSNFCIGQSFDWAAATGGGGSDQAYAIATDGEGNSYVTGWFSESAHFGDIILNSEGGKDVFLAKYNNNGEVIWAVKAWGVASNSAAGITLDGDDFPIITGWFAEDIHFGDITLESQGSYDMFVARYNNEGDVVWAKSAGGEGDDYGNRLITNLEHNVLVSGSFRYAAQFGEITITSEGNRDIFIANYASDGNLQWVKEAGGEGEDRAYDIVCSDDGAIYFTGIFNGKAFFGDYDVMSNSLLSTYIAKMDAIGNFLWVRKGTGGANDYARGFGLSMDNEGYIYGNGTFSGSLTFGNQTVEATGGEFDFDAYLVKYSNEGTLTWLKKAGGYGNDQGMDMVTDDNGNSFVTGFFSNVANFGDYVLESSGKSDIFIAKYNWAGEVMWVKSAGGEYLDYGYGISQGNTENNLLYICGNFQEESVFDDIVLSNWGGLDMFVSKLDYDNIFISESEGESLSISPNPSSGTFILNFDKPQKDITIKIFSAEGRIIVEKHMCDTQKHLEINTDLVPGVYNLHIPELDISSMLIIN